ncbi:DUF1761 domain-containing protein [Polaribacter sp. Z022]|uniref:DUF1761 domain-containing protein n=1 Tax=Polaribacter sp. Z022 TaxID=2927125 RepID=UPI0020228056|nr:DUF1761 domain-containing protein [Polaribacter sp. Z022]MCL7752758.1 DUF1761 domain-containing protein [Polaribacter sp. Z022]
MEMNFYILLIAAIIPMIIGFVWYGPLFGNAWMKEMGFTKESLEGQNMAKIFILSYIFSLLIAFFLQFIVIHQGGVFSSILEPGSTELQGDALTYFQDFMAKYGNNYRTFKHGVLHGVLSGVFFVLPVLSIIAMFEKKSFKYVAINAGYWIVTLAIMGGIICQWL